ncbi:trafficking protein particle complex subunit 10, putative [Phytophthora infestans T30-4]|uniref:Trafficking protein particle complex subunit 10, putative n=1 Tax=Phytophthora infestans (strain T30-4) TaxID=403677 RepID=D0P217_PHYIT|nr:trafficking protein particle complex subunit 10, putative [Phytophthora infestans T30-4]EEY55163.1 trafficking protein particle complex subunit 10, putative [Phytophthora infestans T30-4]|eukprot:XP_002895662.1 trafficking protein particle complex subunit 10, putative [Phytophthora infestans T30-4]
MASVYASVEPQFTRELLSPGLRVGYTDEGGVWQFLAPSLSQRLPLRAIEWRNLVGVTKRIDQLPLHFDEISVQNVKKDLPLACIYLVKCEDLDSYRSVVRPPLVAWVDAMTAAKVEWLVLYVPLGTRPKAAGNVPNPIYRKIFDRLRADYAHRKGGPLLGGAIGPASAHLALQERVCKIDTLEGASVLGQRQQHESQWTELLLRLRHCVMDAFQTKCFQYEESLRVLDAKRRSSGWDFGAFFLAKERLALMYQQMYLQDDAIRHLDELDAIFVNLNETEKQAFQDGSKTSFTSQDPIFTQSPLALELPETQQLIASNRASARLVSLYCFCRQIRTLYVMGSFPQLLTRASSFIETFLAELREMTAENAIDWHQPFLWAVGACMEVSYACELSWSGRDDEWTASSVSVQVAQAIPVEEMSRALGNVLYLARRLLKNFARTSRSRNDLRQLEQVFVAPKLRRAADVCEPYERSLSEVSHLASMYFSQSGRHRFAVFLGGECARYHLARGEFESASRLLRSLARQSEEDGWWTIFGACVRSICRAELALGRSTQAVAACFSMLQLAQEEQVGVSKEEMEELMVALVAINMGELFRPTVAVETTQSSGSALEHGDVRVTLGIANDFPAGVQLEQVRIRNVQLDEKTGVNVVFLHSGVPVGHYTCTGIECVLAGNSFRLLPPSALALASFEIAARESTVQVAIEGAPLLMPRPLAHVETVIVSIQANDDVVANGTLEMRVFKQECGIHNTLRVAMPALSRGGFLSYVVSLAVPPIDQSDLSSELEDEDGSTTSVTVRASVRYHREALDTSVSSTTTEVRCAESTFRVLQPLTEVVRLKRVGARIFASIALTCNPFIPVVIQDYKLICPDQDTVAPEQSPLLTVEQDPNIKLRGTNLRPNDCVHFAFSLTCSAGFDRDVGNSFCSLQLELKYDERWLKTVRIQLPLTEVQGKRYRIDVLPRVQDMTRTLPGDAVEATASEPMTFHVHVQEEASRSNKPALADGASVLSLCLNESSERDWILVGRQLERFTLDPCPGTHDHCRREFSTQKRLLATRTGQLRFPAFRLEVNGQSIPAARVHCQQSSRRVIVS